MSRVDQLLPAAHIGDATGDAARSLARALRATGHEAELYALTIDDALTDEVRPFDAFPPAGPDDVTLLHFALPSPLSAALAAQEGRRALVYHNLTPPDLLLPHCPEIAQLTARGADELRGLADSGRVDLAIGVSSFNTTGLEAAGFPNTATLPLPLDLSRYDVEPDTVLSRSLRGAPTIFLAVGRVAPNKRLEDLLRTAAWYLRHVDPDAWFLIAGGWRGLEAYREALERLHSELNLDDRVRFLGRVSHADLVALYRAARVYVCTSEHEGFCAPLLEAMHFGVPILARAAAAVPETLGGAGVLYDRPDPAQLAEMLALLAHDGPLRARLTAAGSRRVRDFEPSAVAGAWVERLDRLAREGA